MCVSYFLILVVLLLLNGWQEVQELNSDPCISVRALLALIGGLWAGSDDEWRDSRRQIFLGPLLCAIREQRCNELRNPAEHQRLTCKVNETRCNFDFALPETSFPFRTRNRLNGRLFGESICQWPDLFFSISPSEIPVIGLPNTLDRLFQMSRCQTIKREKKLFHLVAEYEAAIVSAVWRPVYS